MSKSVRLSEHFLVYLTEYRLKVGERPRSLAVAFFAMPGATGQELANVLADFFLEVPQSDELLVIAPADLADEARSVSLSHELTNTSKFSGFTEVHYGSIQFDGAWVVASRTSLHDVVKEVQSEAVQSGLRLVFEAGGALLTSRGGYHFVKPSGKHSENFLRAGNALTRSLTAYFVAQACLEWTSKHVFKKIVVDSGSISAVGYAIQNLHARLSDAPANYVIDSFGGYEGMRDYNTSEPLDTIVLVSASTSGGLTKEVEQSFSVPSNRQLILFFVGERPSGFSVLCDLTDRSESIADQGYVRPWRSWAEDDCKLCGNGQPAIRLEGDAFLPASGTLNERLIIKKHAPGGLSPFVEAFGGQDVFRVRASDLASNPVVRTTLVRFAHLLDVEASQNEKIRSSVVARLERFIPLATRQIVVLDDPESRSIAEIAQQLLQKRTGARVPIHGEKELTSLPQPEFEAGYVLVIAGTVVGGRQLRSVSRALRRLHDGGEIAYFIGLGRPSTKVRWDRLLSTLQFGPTGAKHYPVDCVWYLEGDPNRGSQDAWVREQQLLARVQAFALSLPEDDPHRSEYYNLVECRLEQLAKIGKTGENAPLFVPPWYGTEGLVDRLQLNPNFAFWDFPYIPDQITEDEVYFTISTVLHAARHTTDGKYLLMDEGGSRYVLSPENFHRFNDGIIQACILRGALNMELDFRADSSLSADIRDTVSESIRKHRDEEGHGAVEFLISLCGGLTQQKGGFLRIKDSHLEELIQSTKEVEGEIQPYLRLFLHYLTHLVERRACAAQKI
jgi:hypothetical protein